MIMEDGAELSSRGQTASMHSGNTMFGGGAIGSLFRTHHQQ